MTDEAKLRETDAGLMPEGEGWFVVNARDVRWFGTSANGWFTFFEGNDADAQWDDLGFNVSVLDPGHAMTKYHAEPNREVFLVLAGEALLLIEGEERRLRAWDFVHCAPWTAHVLIGAGDGPCVIVAAGPRKQPMQGRYLAAEIAKKHGAAPPYDTEDWDEAFVDAEPLSFRRYVPGDLPDL